MKQLWLDKMYKISIETANLLKGKTFAKDMIFNPVQDVNGDWFISKEEVKGNTNSRYKDLLAGLELAEFVPTKLELGF